LKHKIVLSIYYSVEKPPDYECKFEVVGLPRVISHRAHGIDSMQALTWAFQGIFGELDEYRGSLHWLDAPYDEIGIVVAVGVSEAPDRDVRLDRLR
jgi:hypothetical protein